jgi:hypothetical protein
MYHFHDGLQDLPDPQNYLEPLKYTYLASYRSKAGSSGANRFYIQIDRADVTAESPERVYSLRLQPPNPIFLSPPTQVVRSWQTAERAESEPVLTPDSALVEIMVEFPDSYPRELAETHLLVDGEAVDTRTLGARTSGAGMPDEMQQFTWDLTPYTESGRHTLQAVVIDELGLQQASLEIPVDVVVDELELPWWQALIQERRNLVIIAATLAGAAVLAVLVLAGQRTWSLIEIRRRRKQYSDPLTQPVPAKIEPVSRPRRTQDPSQVRGWPKLPLGQKGVARLVRLSESGHLLPSTSLELAKKEVTFGADPRQATAVLDSPSVSPLHARLHPSGDGEFVLLDAGSTAGTWVNYAPVSKLGSRLHHGDLVHIGRVAFRFEKLEPGEEPQPIVMPYREE